MSRVFQRNGMWWIDYKDHEGIRHRKQIAPDKRVATEVLNDTLAKVAKREHLGVLEESKISFTEFCGVWAERVVPTLAPGTATRWQGILDLHLKPTFRGSLRSVSPDQVEAYRTKRLTAGATHATANVELTVLKHLFGRAVAWSYLAKNPLAGIKKYKEPPGRTRFLSREEITALLQACRVEGFTKPTGHHFSDLLKAYLRPLVVVSLNSGMRLGEVLALRRRDIDWPNRLATLERTKNGEKRHVPLNDAAVLALRSLPARLDTERLFPFRKDQVTVAFKRACQRAGIEDFRLHDLRHTFCSYQAMNGVQGRGLQALMGHKDTRMTARYSHLSDAYLREAVNQVVLGVEDGVENGTYVAPASA
jgi:integrase